MLPRIGLPGGLLLALLSGASVVAEDQFQPTAVRVLGSNRAGASLPLSRVFTQQEGELAIARFDMIEPCLVPNLPALLRVFRNWPPSVNVLTIATERGVIRADGNVRFDFSTIPTRLAAEFIVAEGTTYPIPSGTILGAFVTRFEIVGHVPVMTTTVDFAPGMLPDVLTGPMSITGQQVPGVVKNGPWPCRPRYEVIFTSVVPPGQSDPLVHRVTQ